MCCRANSTAPIRVILVGLRKTKQRHAARRQLCLKENKSVATIKSHSLRHFEELIGLWFPYASNKLLEIPYQSTSSTYQWVKTNKKKILLKLRFKTPLR